MVLAAIAGLLCLIGLTQALVGAALVARFAAGAAREARGSARPAITVLKPLHGDEPLLEQALASLCVQDYPDYQVVFGVHDRADQALTAVRRVQARFPSTDIAVVSDPTGHGANGKVGNLINMLPAAKHDVLAIADSDLHVAPDYLDRLADALAEPGTGLVTTLYAGLPASGRLAARLAAMQITHIFLPGALLARATGRQDCLGATMLLRRDTLARIGGFHALVDHLADDQVLGRRVQAHGLAVRLAHTVPATTVPETTMTAVWRHELRWARTIRTLVPGPFAASILQYPLFWALLAVLLSRGAVWSFGLFLLAWVVRAGAARWVDGALNPSLSGLPVDPHSPRDPTFACPIWLFPLRELMSVAVMLASYAGRRVEWRGQVMTADTPSRSPRVPAGTPPRH
jgi:ceramide glucosyltransferase